MNIYTHILICIFIYIQIYSYSIKIYAYANMRRKWVGMQRNQHLYTLLVGTQRVTWWSSVR